MNGDEGKKMETLLEVNNLSIGIRRGRQLLSSVEDISFRMYPGEILGIVGESGSGKSLTALSIAGLLDGNKEVTGGEVLFRRAKGLENILTLPGNELRNIRGKEISIIFQEPFSSLNPLMKVEAQIAETLELHGERDRERIKSTIRELMEKLKMPDPRKIADTYPHRLSGGMCQRVMIALALICRPRLLIADEPTTALDQNTQRQISGLMKEINRELGTSILFISHDLNVIRELCSRVLVMYSGRILEEGSTEEVLSRPAHEYTKGLAASVPGAANRGKDLANIPGKVPSLEEGRPRGCPFHPRCGKAEARCRGEFPPGRSAGQARLTHCILGDYESTYPAASSGVCCSNKVLYSGFDTEDIRSDLTVPRDGVSNPSARMKDNSGRSEPVLRIRGLSAAYTERPWGVFGKKRIKPVLDNINLDIARGEIFGLVGESGCGKTTLGKCILGLMDYKGEIIINGRKPGKKPSLRERQERAREVEAVFQDPGASLNPAKTVGWILEEPLRAHGTGSAAERAFKADRILDLVGLDASYRKRKPRELSSGQKQRVSIGAALMLDPGLIVADESVSALDVSVAAQILNLFRNLNETLGLSLLFISHNMDQVNYLCGRTAVMRGGRIEEIR